MQDKAYSTNNENYMEWKPKTIIYNSKVGLSSSKTIAQNPLQEMNLDPWFI